MNRIWNKIKGWFIAGWLAILAFLGIALSQSTDITYTPAQFYEDGTNLPLSEIAETRLYCNGDVTPLVTELGADGTFEDAVSLLPQGDNECYGTHVATNGEESLPSAPLTIRVTPTARPNPPENLNTN